LDSKSCAGVSDAGEKGGGKGRGTYEESVFFDAGFGVEGGEAGEDDVVFEACGVNVVVVEAWIVSLGV
jgi:hypothetical protein